MLLSSRILHVFNRLPYIKELHLVMPLKKHVNPYLVRIQYGTGLFLKELCPAASSSFLSEILIWRSMSCSINTVYYMAPFATMILAVPAALLEGTGVVNWFYTHPNIHSSLVIIFSSGVLAFCLNFSIFYVIHSTTAVTFNVAGNLKVAVAVLISWLVFRNPISAMNAFGCAVTLSGCTFYGYVRHRLSQQQLGTPCTPRSLSMLPIVNDKQEEI